MKACKFAVVCLFVCPFIFLRSVIFSFKFKYDSSFLGNCCFIFNYLHVWFHFYATAKIVGGWGGGGWGDRDIKFRVAAVYRYVCS